MKYRRLGTTGLEVSEIGFGGWGIGGVLHGNVGYGPTDQQESAAALRHAFDLGVTFYDTSDIYGGGRSEELIAKELGSVRDQIVIATKVGMVVNGRNEHFDFSLEHIRESLEGSLKRLRTSYVDLYQLHSPSLDDLEQGDQIVPLLECLKKEGKIRAFGISVRTPNDGLTAVTKYRFKSIQVNFHMLDQRALENGLLAQCSEYGVGVIVRTPLCYGFLTGHYSGVEEFHPLDHRSTWSPEQRKLWAGAHRLFKPALADNNSGTPSQSALRFCLSYPVVSTTIPGMLAKRHAEENSAASDMGPLAPEEIAGFEEIYRDNTFFIPSKPRQEELALKELKSL